jgi:hypothetical protein
MQVRNIAAKGGVIVAAVLGLVSSAFAVVPTEATGAIGEVLTDGLAMQAAAWPVLAGITGGFILMKLFKRSASKAT